MNRFFLQFVWLFLFFFHCQSQDNQLRPRIIGGWRPDLEDFPYTALLFRRQVNGPLESNWQFVCSGAIVSKWWVMTAAHCLFHDKSFDGVNSTAQITNAYLRVAFNRDDKILANPWQTQFMKRTSQIYVHPDYNKTEDGFLINDIALLRLKTPLKFNETINRVVLPGPDYDLDYNSEACVAGFGWTRANDATNRHLYAICAPIMSTESCSRYSNKRNYMDPFICIHRPNFKFTATCKGDSGSGLTKKLDNGEFLLLGILSISTACDKGGSPEFFARIAYFDNWIKTTMKYSRIDLGK